MRTCCNTPRVTPQRTAISLTARPRGRALRASAPRRGGPAGLAGPGGRAARSLPGGDVSIGAWAGPCGALPGRAALGGRPGR